MILDIVNIIYVLTIFLVLQRYYRIKTFYFFILVLHFFSIFLFNGFLFEASYMPDQFGYLSMTQNIRNLDFNNETNFLSGNAVLISSIFFAAFPLPFISSFYSIAMINFLLYLFIFIFMWKKQFLESKQLLYFYLFYPSLLLYSSVALRDMLIFCIMFFGTYFLLVNKSKILGFISLFILLLIKFQNLLIYMLTLFIGSLLKRKKSSIDIMIIFMMFILVIVFEDYFSLERINFYRSAFYHENIQKTNELFIVLNSYYELLFYSFPSALKFMFRPLPWEETSFLQLVQFIENCSIAILIGNIFYKNIKYNLLLFYEIKTLNIMLIIALVIYGLVIYNSGTAVRYKFPFIAVYIIFSYYFIHQFKKHINQ